MQPFVNEVFTQQRPSVLKTLLGIYVIVYKCKPSLASLVEPYNQEGIVKVLKKVLNKDNCTGQGDGLIARMRDYAFGKLSQDKKDFITKLLAHQDLKVNLKIFGFDYPRFSDFLQKAFLSEVESHIPTPGASEIHEEEKLSIEETKNGDD